MTIIEDEFILQWKKLDAKYHEDEPFPQYILEYADQIKNFMFPANRKYQGALGNAKGMLDAVKAYATQTRTINT